MVGAALARDLGAEVVGVELDPAYADAARPRLSRVVVADIEALGAEPRLRDNLGEFDVLLAGDVLEHLRDPWTALGAYSALLRPGGTAIVSLPNVRFWQTFWHLAVWGHWPRSSEGLFDSDHLRWFTIGDGVTLVNGAGLQVSRIERQYRVTPSTSRLNRRAHQLGRTPLRSFFVYQFAIVAERA